VVEQVFEGGMLTGVQILRWQGIWGATSAIMLPKVQHLSVI